MKKAIWCDNRKYKLKAIFDVRHSAKKKKYQNKRISIFRAKIDE